MCRLQAVSYFLQVTQFSSTTRNEGVSPRRKTNKSRAARDEGVGSPQSLSVPTRPDCKNSMDLREKADCKQSTKCGKCLKKRWALTY